MILSLGLGEPSYVPDGLIGRPRDCADIDSLAFLQCYARDWLHWEILCFFSTNRDDWYSLPLVAIAVNSPLDGLERALGDLADDHLLDRRVLVTGPVYRLTKDNRLRKLAVRLDAEWLLSRTQSD